MHNSRIKTVEWATLAGTRPRAAGCNARLGVHGSSVQLPIVRLTTADGAAGFGLGRALGLTQNRVEEQARQLLGQPLDALWTLQHGVAPQAQAVEFALWDLAGQLAHKPVYQLVAERTGRALDLTADGSLRVPCYDTSLYIDDLHLDSDEEAAALIAEEARFGYEHGHRAFKIKVGRGARHMAVEPGTRRDILVIRAVRQAVGPDATLMIDANNGYTLNLAKRVLRESADCNLFWLEEAFHEDRVLYEDLREWMEKEGLSVLIADGEGQASPSLMPWAEAGVVDVVQYDIFGHGFGAWLETGQQLDAWGARSAPHHYGRHYGNYVAGHLAGAIDHFTFVEWDQARTPGLDDAAYALEGGSRHFARCPRFWPAARRHAFPAGCGGKWVYGDVVKITNASRLSLRKAAWLDHKCNARRPPGEQPSRRPRRALRSRANQLRNELNVGAACSRTIRTYPVGFKRSDGAHRDCAATSSAYAT